MTLVTSHTYFLSTIRHIPDISIIIVFIQHEKFFYFLDQFQKVGWVTLLLANF